MYLGAYTTGSTVFFGFTTVSASGAPSALSSAAVTVYQDASTVQNATGITLVSSFDTITGLNRVTAEMVATSTFYQPGSHFMAILSSGGTVTSDLAGYVLAHWSIRTPPASVSTAVNISTATSIDGVTSVNSTVEADVALWRGTAPSTLGTNSHVVPSSTASILSASSVTSVGAVDSTVQADVALWRGTAPSTLGPNANIAISTASEIASVATAQNLISISTTALILINAEADAAIETYRLDHLLSAAGSSDDVADESLWVKLVTGTTSYTDFDSTTDALQPIRDALFQSSTDAVQVSTAVAISTASEIALVESVGSTVQADVALWRGTAPSTLGTNAFLSISTTSEIATVATAQNLITISTTGALVLNAEVVDAVNVDTYSEPSSGPPPVDPTIAEMLTWQHFTLRHQIRVNSSNKTFFDSSGAVLWTKGLLGDSATYIELLGTTAT